MRAVLTIACFTIRQYARHRLFLSGLVVAALVLSTGFLLAGLAVSERERVMTDFGFAAAEFFVFLLAVFFCVNLVYEEKESGSLSLLLAHPAARWQFLAGKYVGIQACALSTLWLLGLVHILALASLEIALHPEFIAILFFSGLKICLIGAVALLASLFFTAPVTAFLVSLMVWITGHLTGELSFLTQHAAHPFARSLMLFIRSTVPNFALLSLRDYWSLPQPPSANWLLAGIGYAALYTLGALLLAFYLFRRHEP